MHIAPGTPSAPSGVIRIGTAGWVPRWRRLLRMRGADELAALAQGMRTVEITQSFSATQQPATYRAWARATPEDFVFAVKARRYITHVKKLCNVSTALANFFASGILALGPKLGPVLWQLPPNVAFDPDRLEQFLVQLPHGTVAAARLAAGHDDRVADHAWTVTDSDRPIRHALEVRHPSFADPVFAELLRAHGVALVISDSAGAWPCFEAATAGYVYVRLHGDAELYTSGYTASALDDWADKVRTWACGDSPDSQHTFAPPAPRWPRDVFVYFDNDVKAHAPFDAVALAQRLGVGP